MESFFPEKPANQTNDAAERRRKGRVKAHQMTSELGQILDISASGMRILRRSAKCPVEVNQVLNLHVRTEIDRFSVPAKIIRITQTAKKQWELAVEIINPTPEIREKLMIQGRSAGMKGFAHLD